MRREKMSKNRKKEDGIFYDFATGRCWEHNGKSKRLLWTESMVRELRAKFPVMHSEELAGMLQMCKRTLERKAKELGIKKNPQWLAKNMEESRRIARSCTRRGLNPGCYKSGHVPTHGFQKGRVFSKEIEEKRVAHLRESMKLRKHKQNANKNGVSGEQSEE